MPFSPRSHSHRESISSSSSSFVDYLACFWCFSFYYFAVGVSPLLLPSMRTPSRGVTCRSRGRFSERWRDPSKTLLSGVQGQRYLRTAHEARTAYVVTLRRPVPLALHCGQGLDSHVLPAACLCAWGDMKRRNNTVIDFSMCVCYVKHRGW